MSDEDENTVEIELRPGHKSILHTLYDSSKPLKRSDIESISGVSEGSFWHFIDPLKEWGYVAVVDTEERPGGQIDANLYGLTDEGERTTSDLLDRPPADLVARVEQLESRMDHFDEEVERLDGRFENTKDWIRLQFSKHLGVEY